MGLCIRGSVRCHSRHGPFRALTTVKRSKTVLGERNFSNKFFVLSFLSLFFFFALSRSASPFSRREEFEEGIGGRNSWKLRKLVSLCNSYSSLRAITRRGGIIKKALSKSIFSKEHSYNFCYHTLTLLI